MNPAIKERWLQALRSGNYQQGRNHLRVQYKGMEHFCCLGVLCDLAVQDGITRWSVDDHSAEEGFLLYKIDDEPELLPQAVATWAGMDLADTREDRQPTLETSQGAAPVHALNDGWYSASLASRLEPMSFEQIADLIEQQL